MERFYYKTADGKGLLNLKTPDFDGVVGYTKITEEEYISELERLSPKLIKGK